MFRLLVCYKLLCWTSKEVNDIVIAGLSLYRSHLDLWPRGCPGGLSGGCSGGRHGGGGWCRSWCDHGDSVGLREPHAPCGAGPGVHLHYVQHVGTAANFPPIIVIYILVSRLLPSVD